VQLSAEEALIYNYLKTRPEVFVDTIARECQIPLSKLSAILLSLEFSGLLKSHPGKMYTII
jgi:DNA processing protein